MIDMTGAVLIQQRKRERAELEKWNRLSEKAKHLFYNVLAFLLIAIIALFLSGLDSIMELIPL